MTEERKPSTPAANWRQEGQTDPHDKKYECERAGLVMGQLTDDEIANAVFLCDHRTSVDSIVYLTAAKDRIRWLSRSLEGANAANRVLSDALTTANEKLSKAVVLPERYSFDCGVCADPNGEWVAVDDIKDAIKAACGTVEGE
ncbi:hypothetical protein WFR23_00555 [Yersinia enterocolitica]